MISDQIDITAGIGGAFFGGIGLAGEKQGDQRRCGKIQQIGRDTVMLGKSQKIMTLIGCDFIISLSFKFVFHMLFQPAQSEI